MTHSATSDTTPSSHSLIESHRVEGTQVYDRAGQPIGTIHHLVIEKISGRVVYTVMSFGGFLGIGAHTHTIPWEKLEFDSQLGGYRTDITREELTGAPVTYGNEEIWQDRKREQEVFEYWRLQGYWGMQ